MIHGEQWTKQIKKYRPETTAAIATTHKLTKKTTQIVQKQ